MGTTVVWFRRDLRVHDNAALAEACADSGRVVPLFVLDPRLLRGRFASANRTRYLLDCLAALDGELRERGGRLIVRTGRFEDEVARVAREAGAERVLAAGDVSPYARRRDRRVAAALGDTAQLELRPGLFIAWLGRLRKGDGEPYKVYSPFRRAWAQQPRRMIEHAPGAVAVPSRLRSERRPSLSALGLGGGEARALEDRPEPGEQAALEAMEAWVDGGLASYADSRNVLAEPSSRMSQYLHLGCLSPLVLESRVCESSAKGALTYRRELAWRDFYAYVQLLYDGRSMRPAPRWSSDAEAFDAWRAGRTGFPVVDAAMRQLLACGWMHNRARMIVGSFLTKDLHIDWRAGERHFMEHLIDGDVGSNNGGWQWIAGTGTDPHDFQRVFNPWLQQERFDPEGRYVRRWVPELAEVPDERLSRPWEMSDAEQRSAGCVIGRDYPEPIVDHMTERRAAIEAYRAARV